MGNLNGILSRLKEEDGYQEKASNSQLDSKNANVGYNNYTKYARDINSQKLMGCQGQAWCGTYQFWIEMQEFGVIKALENFCMTRNSYVAYNVFSTRDAFKKKGKYVKNPKVGYLVVFKQSHIARIIGVTTTHIYTNEGNTSAKHGDRNGGTVKEKVYLRSDSLIDGYCAIEYSHAETPTATEWVKNDTGWWYRNADGSYPFNEWMKLSGEWYYFDSNGYAVTGWIRLSGKWYYLNKAGEDTECAMATGWKIINDKWYYLKLNSGEMLTDWQMIDGKWYYFRLEGDMVANEWIKHKDKDYYLEGNGAMATSKWIGQYYVGADGAWIVGYK